MDFEKFKTWFNPEKNPDLDPAFQYQADHLPTFWLLGKTGAGKSSLVHAVTGNSAIEIGNGFQPCTTTADHYDYPPNKPLIRFLDTRGLGEADYDPSEDIAECQNRSHALIIVMKAEEVEQSSVLTALRQIKNSGVIKQIITVHTGIFLLDDAEHNVQYNQSQIENIWGKSIPSVSVDFECEDGSSFGVDTLKQALAELLPMLALLTTDEEHQNQEEANFAQLKTEILWYSGTAGASDAVPAVGLVSVPVIQAKMLHSLANQYGLDWDKQALTEFIGTLGTSFSIQYASKLGIRELVKLIPVYGQVVGGATAAVISFCTTYAIGRVACKYMYHKSKGEPVSEEELKAMYNAAFEDIKELTHREKNHQ